MMLVWSVKTDLSIQKLLVHSSFILGPSWESSIHGQGREQIKLGFIHSFLNFFHLFAHSFNEYLLNGFIFLVLTA